MADDASVPRNNATWIMFSARPDLLSVIDVIGRKPFSVVAKARSRPVI
jgi:hypothetical protein